MGLLDQIPGELKLYIGGLFTVRRRETLVENGITHILSILRMQLDQELFGGFEHKLVEVDDVEDENLLEHFEDCNRFIQQALDSGGGVLVHCAMGKSRSATVICAYLMHFHGMSPGEALSTLREVRPFCEPNDGFMKQLEMYHQIGPQNDVQESPLYQKWLFVREVDLSRACGLAPEAEKIRFEDEHSTESASSDFGLRCRKCRRTLATSQYLVGHVPRSTTSSVRSDPGAEVAPSTACAHYFLDPLSWMRPELEQGKLDGRLECPKCKTNVGKYAWQGMQCSCGGWVVPGISLTKGRIDEVKSSPAGTAAMGIRMPPPASPGRKTGPGQQNL